MQEQNNEPKQSVSLPLGTRLIVFIGILVGMLLLVLGDSLEASGVYYAGAFILPVTLLWGSLYMKEESIGLRITLLAVGGYLVASGLLSGLSALSAIFR